MSAKRPEDLARIDLRGAPAPGARYTSGLSTHDEALSHGRWIGRYWSANGFIEPERNLTRLNDRLDLPLHAFTLNLDGQALHYGWTHEGGEVDETERGTHAAIRLRHTVRPVGLTINTVSDGTGFLVRWLEITNTGDRPAALGAVAPWAGVVGRAVRWEETMPHGATVFSVGYFEDCRWGNEGAFSWLDLAPGGFRVQSMLGWSGHGMPFFVLRNNLTGQLVVGALAWSGNWGIDLYYEPLPGEALVWFAAGPNQPGPLRLIAPGETVATPAVHLGYVDADLDGAVQAYHEHLRRSVLPEFEPERHLLVSSNHWGYSSDELSGVALRHEVEVAAQLGCELFTVDAGWYADRGVGWWTRVGDWDEGNRIDGGLAALYDYARSKGMRCGLWIDIERIGPDSRIAREHPDWTVTLYGDVASSALNPAVPEAREYMERKLCEIIERYRLDLFRLDRNVHVWENGQNLVDGYLENVTWRHYEFVHDLYRRLRQRFPNLILENCAGGGGRMDLGMMGIFDYTMITDWPRAPRSVKIFNGVSLALPPERIMQIGGVAQEGQERADLDFLMRTLIFGHVYVSGIYPDGASANPAHMARIRHALDLHKTFIRPFLPTSRLYHHRPVLKGREPSGWCAWETVAADRAQAAVAIFRLAGPAEPEYRLRLRGVDVGARYQVTLDNTGDTAEISGLALAQEGLLIRLEKPLSSELLLLRGTGRGRGGGAG